MRYAEHIMLRGALALLFVVIAAGCLGPPSDDPDDWQVDTSVEYRPALSAPRFLVPSALLPDDTPVLASNNNVAIELFEERLFVAWRTAPTHWASTETTLYVISSADGGGRWEKELEIYLGTDMREPLLYAHQGKLRLAFFEAGDDTFAFEPRRMWRSERRALADWTELEEWGEPAEVPWDVKVRDGRVYLTSYLGEHYQSGAADVEVRFSSSDDGASFDAAVVYQGGASEASFELDEGGALWAVLRNEDGDESGFGSLVCTAPSSDLTAWDCPGESDPERYDSPRLLRHGDDLYLIARRDVGGQYDMQARDKSIDEQRRDNQAAYWTRPKRTALYRVDRAARAVVHLVDLPSAGDTAFPSVRRTGAHSFLVANYTSPLDDLDRSWIEGQGADDGTAIYLIDLTFEPE